MRIIIWILGAATALWCIYWAVAAGFIERGAEGWLADRRAEGWQAEAASINTSGFPYRLDTELVDLALADPGTGVLWQMPRLDIRALAYAPNHVIAIFPDSQTLASPFDTLTLESGDMRASLRVEGTRVALSETTAEMTDVTAKSTQGWEVTLEEGLMAMRADQETANAYDIFFTARNLRPSDALRLGLDPQGRLPDTFETLEFDASAQFDAPWDRFAIERTRPQPVRISLKSFDATWGQLELRAVGDLDIDGEGTPEGRITVKATNWREIIRIGQALGTIPEAMVPTITRALEVLASLSGPPNTIDVPLSFQRGFVSLGPLPLGPAPKLRLR
ncbi:MAG: DUF2125 domain-containing protein [Pseudomonadota bacterium]